MLGAYVDDLPLACDNTTWVTQFKSTLGNRFKPKDHGELTHILGMHITRDRQARALSINRSQYMVDILDKHGMAGCSPSALPMGPNFLATLVPLTCHAMDVYPSLFGSL
jgi:hypothetical protein